MHATGEQVHRVLHEAYDDPFGGTTVTAVAVTATLRNETEFPDHLVDPLPFVVRNQFLTQLAHCHEHRGDRIAQLVGYASGHITCAAAARVSVSFTSVRRATLPSAPTVTARSHAGTPPLIVVVVR